jgi:hypothetical protein
MNQTSNKPEIITFIAAFYDKSRISGALPAGVIKSVPLLGFIQTRGHRACELSTLDCWFPTSWAPVPGGLASNQHFKDNGQRREDPNDCWTKMSVFGTLGLNNPARTEDRQKRKVLLGWRGQRPSAQLAAIGDAGDACI